MNIYAGLLFLQGHIADAELARRLVEPVDEVVEDDVPTGVAATQQNHAPCPCGES